MKLLKFSILFLILFLFCFINCSNAQWVQGSNGMGNVTVQSLTGNLNTIFAGVWNNGGVYKSSDNGTNWYQTALDNRYISTLAVSGNYIFAGTDFGVYITSNNGTSWTQTLNNRTVYSLLISGSYIFAGTYQYGAYFTTNNGTNWTQTSFNDRTLYSLASNGNNIYAGTYGYGVHLSTDNGITWMQSSMNSGDVPSLAVNGNNVYAGTAFPDNGVYLSTNNGTTWIQTSLNNRRILSLLVNGNNIFAGTDTSGFYVSNNNGGSWIQKNDGLYNNTKVPALYLLNGFIFAGTQYSVYRRPLSQIIGIHPISNEIPLRFQLYQNYPNPFNPNTKIKFSVSTAAQTFLSVYDNLGREVAALVNEQLQPGTYEADWSSDKLSSGVYYYRIVMHSDNLSTADFTDIKKMIFIK